MRVPAKRKMLEIAADGKEHTTKDFLDECDNARGSIYKYRKEMVNDDHFLERVLGADDKVRYKITEPGMKELNKIKLKEQFSSTLDSCTKDELQQMVLTSTKRAEKWKKLAMMKTEEGRKLSAPFRFSYEEQAAKVAKGPASFTAMYERLKRDLNQPQQEPSKSKEKGRRKRVAS